MQTRRVEVFDTTLRDGEQGAGASMTYEAKVAIAEQLDRMGVDVIEAGFPAASLEASETVSAIARNTKNAVVCALARANDYDIDCAVAALKGAKRPRLHTFLGTSPKHRAKLGRSEEEVLLCVHRSVSYAVALMRGGVVQWSAEDATRTESEFLCSAVEIAVKAGASVINIPDTVGYALPHKYAELIAALQNRVPGIEKVKLSVHCHNDLGLAVANSLTGIMAGARQAECTINGIGERAGNTSLEELVMALRVHEQELCFMTGLNTRMFCELSRAVSEASGFAVARNKAVVGANAFAHESGIHQDGVIKDPGSYEIMLPEDVGAVRSLPLGKLSGHHALEVHLARLGYAFGPDAIRAALGELKRFAVGSHTITDEDLHRIARKLV